MPEQHNIEWKTTWKDEYLKWICGFAKVQAVCQAKGSPAPRFEVLGEDMTVTFFAAGQGKTVQASGETVQASGGNDQASGESDQASGGSMLSRNKLERIQQEILAYCVEARSLGEIANKLGLRHLPSLRAAYIKPLLGSRLEMTHPENPRHMHQRYRTIVSDDKQKG